MYKLFYNLVVNVVLSVICVSNIIIIVLLTHFAGMVMSLYSLPKPNCSQHLYKQLVLRLKPKLV